jgi:hypothetical protein
MRRVARFASNPPCELTGHPKSLAIERQQERVYPFPGGADDEVFGLSLFATTVEQEKTRALRFQTS